MTRSGFTITIIALASLAGCMSKGSSGFFGPSDSDIEKQVTAQWRQDHPQAKLAPTVKASQGMISLTGTLESPQARIDAVRDAWQPDGVTEVVDELHVSEEASPSARKDHAMTIKLRTRLTFDMDVVSTNYSIDTLNGTIYLMGWARDAGELAKVTKTAELTAGKGKVVSYVRVMPGAKS